MKMIMKLIFSFFLIPITYASELIIISYQNESKMIESLEKILMNDYHIPLGLIKKVKSEFECDIKENAILHLCLTKENEMKFVDLNVKRVNEVLGVFYEN